jgi:16S rRNA (guanine966-N2)-methyltransferase
MGVRPTSDRVREAIFNILVHGELLPGGIEDAVVVDLFAGTGALGLEALSRGARHVTFFERDGGALKALKRNLATLKEDGRARVLARDATRPGGRVGEPATLAFLDPPYGEGLAEPALAALLVGGWLAADALVVVEIGARDAFRAPVGFEEADRRRWGATVACFLRRAP